MENNMSNKLTCMKVSRDILHKSRLDFPEYLGHFMGWNVFLSDELDKDEYVICLDEREVKMCKRKYKLKQITNKLNATL